NFTELVEGIFGTERRSAPIRSEVGGAFADLYSSSKTIQTLISDVKVSSTDQRLELIDVPEQQSSPIYAKVESERIVLDTGRDLHPLLRKEALTETRKYLQTEL